MIKSPLAVNKPKSISSAQVLRELQRIFNPSRLFAPWLDAVRAERARENANQRRRRRDKYLQVKVGHGGTLDPMATGVLIVGVGKGTKQLQNFLECTKSYEATVLFGAATDTYDVLGKILQKAPCEHITETSVATALGAFRGKIMQKPPLYSALRVQGKRLYEYAREGIDVPLEIQERSMEVKELEIVEWLNGGEHAYKWPSEEAGEEIEVAERLLGLQEGPPNPTGTSGSAADQTQPHLSAGSKRKRTNDSDDDCVTTKKPISARQIDEEEEEKKEQDPEFNMSGALQNQSPKPPPSEPPTPTKSELNPAETKPPLHETPPPKNQQPLPAEPSPTKPSPTIPSPTRKGPPAVTLRMTVTSGFYVRSLSHDLGKAVGSLAMMSQLVRTRQGGFELGRNVLEWEDLEQGEEVWGPRVEAMLASWEGGVGVGVGDGGG